MISDEFGLIRNARARRDRYRRRRERRVLLGLLLMLLAAGAIGWLVVQQRPVPRHSPLVDLPPPPPLPEQRLLPVAPDQARVENAAIPFVAAPLVPARPFRFGADTASRERAVDCLAAAAWYEAGDDPPAERAVIQTVLNRVRHPAFPATVCGVVFQGSERRTGCQFTFTCDGAMARIPGAIAWQRARIIARAALAGAVDPAVGLATHYHADYVVPYWQRSLEKAAQVGNQIFYRWPGFWGTLPAFRRPVGGREPLVAALAGLSGAHRANDADAPVIALPAPPPAEAPPAAGAPPPPLPALPAEALRGNVVKGTSVDQQSFFIALDPNAFPGGYALTALALCKGKRDCRVLGWRDARQVAAALPLAPDAARALSFAYLRDHGRERALWNCAQIARPSPDQCLPSEDGLATLLLAGP